MDENMIFLIVTLNVMGIVFNAICTLIVIVCITKTLTISSNHEKGKA